MDGIDFIVDDEGRPKAVVIDLRLHEELWENVYDVWLAEQRKDEPRLTAEEVDDMLRAAGKLDEPALVGA